MRRENWNLFLMDLPEQTNRRKFLHDNCAFYVNTMGNVEYRFDFSTHPGSWDSFVISLGVRKLIHVTRNLRHFILCFALLLSAGGKPKEF